MAAVKGDYVILMSEGEKATPGLWKVMDVMKNSELAVRMERDPHIKGGRAMVDPKTVVMNLGSKPAPGKVYGYDVGAMYRKTVELDVIALAVFGRPSKEDVKTIGKAFNFAHRALSKHGLEKLFDEDISYELVPKSGKWAGMFISSRNLDKGPHRLKISYEHIKKEASAEYIALHELGHAIECVLKEYKEIWVRWLHIYTKTVSPVRVTVKDCALLLKSLLQHAGTVEEGTSPTKSWQHELEEDDVPKAHAIFRWIKTNRHLSAKELDMLLLADKEDEVTGLWPAHSIDTKSDLKPLVSEYATVSMSELWAESLAFKFTGRQLPKAIDRLVDETLAIAKNHFKTV